MPNSLSRRRFTQTAGVLCGLSVFGSSSRASAAAAHVDTPRVISKTPHYYCGWPTLTRRANGELLVVWSGGRQQHVCPFGRVDMMRSNDDGETWSWPRTLLDGPIDDRDAGIVETTQGSLLVTTFTSLAYDTPAFRAALAKQDGEPGSWPQEKRETWRAAHQRINEAQRKAELGEWMIRSTDGGVTWSARYPSIVNSPHGPIQSDDGRLIYAGKRLWTGERQVGVCQSSDDGQSWEWLSDIPIREGDQSKNYHELHAADLGGGKLVVHIRNHSQRNHRETLQCESSDGGETWTTPHSIGVWGLPSFLTVLRDGRLVMTYGYRRAPFGNQARVSEDGGNSWSDPITISGDGLGGDLGYPSTVELGDGSLLTVWYEHMKGSPNAVLRQARWTLA
ncbi:sialidase family protein [Roseimaritima ulvae]|uniref:BNR/Asp-box repeat protein n=1 Tax=Roseimaritima ulvae TaxID=980254 RepID=A0A5B9QWZ2_9BACT|nr:sialidase family protein [Roseimaritima ulvae]QEG41636.1 BNR/Asp-box repeat protein [Roseimaritima ulvae]